MKVSMVIRGRAQQEFPGHVGYPAAAHTTIRSDMAASTISGTLETETLKGVSEITADVMIEQQRNDVGEWRPRRIHVVKIHSTRGGSD
jgi:hypothetical protein